MIKGSCHCGAVTFELPRLPEWLKDCNCSICRRLGTLWAYYTLQEVRFTGQPDATFGYVWGDRTVAFHSCRTCGCTTHWLRLDPKPDSRVGVNGRLLAPEVFAGLRIRPFDGADSFHYLD